MIRMLEYKILKGSLLLTFLIIQTLSYNSEGSPFYPDIRETSVIGADGGSIMAEDPESGLSAGIYIPEGALRENTTITLLLHGTKQPGVLGKTVINGISVLPQNLFFMEKVRMEVYNPPGDVTRSMLLYHIANEQFLIPLGSLEHHIDENYIEGTFYVSGKFSLGIPTATEVVTQIKKLAAYNPVRPLGYTDIDKQIMLTAGIEEFYDNTLAKGPFTNMYSEYFPSVSCISSAGDDCLRWQKVLTQVEGHVTWMNLRRLSGSDQSASAATEQADAERALKHGIEDYLSKQSGANRCGGYLKAAEKYLETARKLGMNTQQYSFIDQRYNQLVNECSFEFTVETHEWINHPKETQSDGATFEEKSDWYGTIRCVIPPSEFGMVQPRIMASEGTMNLHYEKHWVGDEKNDHTETNGTWKARKITGSARFMTNDSGVRIPADVSITIFWDKNVTTRLWGKPGKEDKPFDWTSTDTNPAEESKSYLLKHGYEEKIGNEAAGRSTKIIFLRNPFDMKDDPNDCF